MSQKQRLQIAFITAVNAQDKKSKSGTLYYLSKSLNEYCGDVNYIHILRPNTITIRYLFHNLFAEFTRLFIIEKFKELFWKVLGKRYSWERTTRISRYYAKIIQRKLQERHYDLIFAALASTEIAFLNTQIPIIYESDAVFHTMIDYYPSYTNLSKKALRQGELLEKMALDKARLFIANSEWAADSALKHYGIYKNKIKVMHLPVCIDSVPAIGATQEAKRNVCRLLFIGLDWERKGGDIAVNAAEELNKLGIKTELTIVCGSVPQQYHQIPSVALAGYLDKNQVKDKKQYEDLISDAHFLILPSRVECVANIFLEAATYGLPIITTDTPGINSVVLHNASGLILNQGASGKDFALAIKSVWNSQDKYESMRQKSRQLFEEQFSGEVWAHKANQIINSILPGFGRTSKSE